MKLNKYVLIAVSFVLLHSIPTKILADAVAAAGSTVGPGGAVAVADEVRIERIRKIIVELAAGMRKWLKMLQAWEKEEDKKSEISRELRDRINDIDKKNDRLDKELTKISREMQTDAGKQEVEKMESELRKEMMQEIERAGGKQEVEKMMKEFVQVFEPLERAMPKKSQTQSTTINGDEARIARAREIKVELLGIMKILREKAAREVGGDIIDKLGKLVGEIEAISEAMQTEVGKQVVKQISSEID